MKRPTELFDRAAEWKQLDEFVSQPGSGTHLALVRGRRRQGKSFLLRRLAQSVNGFYYQAVEEERSQALAGLGAALGTFLKVPGGRLALDSWDAAITAIGDMPPSRRPNLVVIDAQGRLRLKVNGTPDKETLQKVLQTAQNLRAEAAGLR